MKTNLIIQNLKCGGCEATILERLSGLQNITNISIDQEESEISFEYISPDTIETVKSELSKLGYPVVGEKNNLSKKAKSYVSCAIGKMKQ